MFEKIFRALEPFGQLLADCLFNHPLSRKTDQGAGLGDDTVV